MKNKYLEQSNDIIDLMIWWKNLSKGWKFYFKQNIIYTGLESYKKTFSLNLKQDIFLGLEKLLKLYYIIRN